jgi:23S rRNA (uracil1939-C5)-methyltransferase
LAARQLRPGDTVEVAVAELDELGAGLARAGSPTSPLRVHIAGALPGERVRAQLAHVSEHAGAAERDAWADLREVLLASRERVEAACPAHGKCGGCNLMGLAYPAQLEYKRQRVAQQIARHLDLPRVEVGACVESPLTLGYRNQAKLVYGRDAGTGLPVLGAFAPRSHRVVDLAGCRVVEPVLEEVRARVLALLLDKRVEPFDEHRRTGALRYVVMRATAAGRVLVALVSARADWPEASPIARELAASCPAVAGVVLNVNPTTGNRIFGDDERALWGEAAIEDTVGDTRVRLVARSFFQANRAVAGRIYRDIVAAAPEGLRRAVDVYAGSGAIALSLAARAAEVLAIEENRAAATAAGQFVAEIGGDSARVRMVAGDAALCLAQVDAADFVVVDPPRKGCSPSVLAEVARLRPRFVVYVSCEPATLARDLACLAASGARILRITPYDMMPNTSHVETLALVEFS